MTILDIAGIGIGPFNLGLASLLSTHGSLKSVFLERKPGFRWHEGLLLPGTTLQVPFLADLVSMADPTHRLSFLNYLAAYDRLYKFYFYEKFMIPRQEYDDYCRWASQQLENCRFGEAVVDLEYERAGDTFNVKTKLAATGATKTYRSRNVAVGVGTVPFLPGWSALRGGAPVYHSAEFAIRKAELLNARRVTVIGSGQSAAECVLALFQELTPQRIASGASIHWITRSPGFFPMEYSKLGLEYFTPDYMREFHKLPREARRRVVEDQGLLYKGISFSTIADIFDLLYERSIGGRDPGLTLAANCAVRDIEANGRTQGLKISVTHNLSKEEAFIDADAVVAATGYRHAWPEWIEHLKGSVLAICDKGSLIVGDDFRAQRCDEGAEGSVFIQNAETFHHGVGAPDLGLGPYRNAVIINQLLGKEYYRVNTTTSFQQFGIPTTNSRSSNMSGDVYARAV